MKINLYDAFDNLSIENADAIINEEISIDFDSSITERIKSNVLAEIGEKQGEQSKHRSKFPFRRLIAVAAAVLVIGGATSVGANNYFRPDNKINQMIELKGDIDLNTLGKTVDCTASSSGLDFHINQVLCDNNILMTAIECPKYNGRYVQPMVMSSTGDTHFMIYVNGKEQPTGYSIYDGQTEFITHPRELQENAFYITADGLENIRNSSEIKIAFDKLVYFDAEDTEDAEDGMPEVCDVDGNWEFVFTLDRSNTRKALDVNDIVFENGEKYCAKEFTISPLGFNYEFNLKYVEPTGDYEHDKSLPPIIENGSILFSKHLSTSLNGEDMIVITMKDGTIYGNGDEHYAIESHCSMSTSDILHTSSGSIEAAFLTAIDVNNIKTIEILDKVLYEAE